MFRQDSLCSSLYQLPFVLSLGITKESLASFLIPSYQVFIHID